MGGGKVYGLPKKSELDALRHSSGTVTQTKVLTAQVIYAAEANLMEKSNGGFAKLSTTQAAKEVARFLESAGFAGLSASYATLTDNHGNAFLLHNSGTNEGFTVTDKSDYLKMKKKR